jgi:hypothetical protein
VSHLHTSTRLDDFPVAVDSLMTFDIDFCHFLLTLSLLYDAPGALRNLTKLVDP